MKNKLPLAGSALAALALAAMALPAAAEQAVADAETPTEEADAIIVTAPRLAGSVDVAIPADLVLDAGAIESYGVSSVTDLLSALSAQTRSGRGRGDGRPVILLGGKRISGFAEIRDLPTEAIQRVEILPEDVALRYGYSADQRVINFILKPGFSAITVEGDIGGPTAGGRTDYEAELALIRIAQNGRLNLNADYARSDAILENERSIVPEGADETAYRTLAPKTQDLKLNAVLSRTLGKSVGATISVQHDRVDTQSLFGLTDGSITTRDPLVRDGETRLLSGGVTLDGRIARFNWTATATGERTTSLALTDQDQLGATGRDSARSRLMVGTAALSITGPLAELPAGAVSLNLTTGGEMRDLDSVANRSGRETVASVSRDEANVRANLDIPLTSRRRAVLGAVGDLSINLNGGYRDLSDFGGVKSFGYGVNWTPVKGVTLLASYAAAEAAPSPTQLGDAVLVTPNALVFDYVRGETALVALTTGGNALLKAEERRDMKFGLSYEPQWLEGMTLTANYFRNRSTDPIAGFPALTAVIQSAFPERFTRDAGGALVAVDQRAINFLASRSEQLRWGLSFQKQFGMPQASARSGPRGAGGPPGGGRGFGPFGGGQGGRWSASLFHTVKFVDEIDVGANTPTLDLLGGDAISQSGGSPRHTLELEGGWFNKGVGFRVNGAHQAATNVRIAGQNSGLRFSDLTTLNLRFFINFEQKKSVTDKLPFLKGTRFVVRVDNLFDDIQDVRDAQGLVPLRYQPGYLDPIGRRVEVSLRKIF